MKLARMPDGSPEIFHTLQGEGRNTGMPSVFIRASLCNLHCHWCDTDYTWNWDDTSFAHVRDADPGYRKFQRADWIVDATPGEVLGIASRFSCPNFVFTGGEPLLQEKGWVELMSLLDREVEGRCHFEIETNGTLLPGPAFLERIDQINVSPKLENSRVPESLRVKKEVLGELHATGMADFKFVLGEQSDLTEIESLVREAGISGDHVFLMPRANTPAELRDNQGFVAELAKAKGWRYSDRLHLRLFGAKRGV